MKNRLRITALLQPFAACVLLVTTIIAAAAEPARAPLQAQRPLPYTAERFSLPGPVAGVVVKVDLADPRVRVKVALADDRDPDGDGPCVGQLDTTSNAARKQDFQIAINASFFEVAVSREVSGKKISYFAGNCGYPVGWHFSAGKLLASPAGDKFRATLIVHDNGRVSLVADVKRLPADTRFAVSGNALVLAQGKAVAAANDSVRHPRSAVGISADANTLFLVAVDGRQEQHSRGTTLAELAAIMLSFGADSAINLDGGGSTSLVLKDPASGVFAVANQPSDQAALPLPLAVERPVIDVIGIHIAP